MARPKGSKNKKTIAKSANIEAQMAEKAAAKEALDREAEAIAQMIAENTEKLKDIRKEQKALDRQIAKLEAQKAQAEALALAESKKQELQAKIDTLIADGKSIDDIIGMLK